MTTVGLDPVFAAIDAHRAAEARFNATLKVLDQLTDADVDEDDPRMRAVERTSRRADAATKPHTLVRTRPTTLAGVIALLTYLADYEDDGNATDDWSDGLHRMLARALTDITRTRRMT
jgi:hypothetical protein